jgi:glycosyltransferase involved in cell wall biosynthesis
MEMPPHKVRFSKRAVVFDVTHLVTRLNRQATSGIDRVDLAYGRYFSDESSRIACGTHYGLFAPHIWSPEKVVSLVKLFELAQRETEQTDGLAWQNRVVGLMATGGRYDASGELLSMKDRLTLLPRQGAFRISHDLGRSVPLNAIYLNAAQHAFEHSRFFRWLDRRPDIVPVFLVHDLIPLDYPEFFPSENYGRFKRRVDTIVKHARAIITTTHDVATRINAEYRQRGRAPVPIHVEPLASPLELKEIGQNINLNFNAPYFIMVSTIEPRKNHLLLINVWRELARRGGIVPKLVLVGRRGWLCDQVCRELDLAPDLKPHIVEISGLPSVHLRGLISKARALLLPSFKEGYGLSIVEALSLGTPVVCSDIPVFREVSQNAAMFLSPIDGAGWLRAIDRLGTENSELHQQLLARAKDFVAPTWSGYFKKIEEFIVNL